LSRFEGGKLTCIHRVFGLLLISMAIVEPKAAREKFELTCEHFALLNDFKVHQSIFLSGNTWRTFCEAVTSISKMETKPNRVNQFCSRLDGHSEERRKIDESTNDCKAN
jgi:hypothetical protein